MLTIPVFRQNRKYDCGSACVKAVLAYWELKYPRLAASGWPNPIDGTDPRVLEAVLRKCGLQVVSGEMTVGLLKHFVAVGWPVICLVRSEGVGHYVVVGGVARGRVTYMDPEDDGLQVETQAAFAERWRAGDVCRTGTAYFQWGVAAGVEF